MEDKHKYDINVENYLAALIVDGEYKTSNSNKAQENNDFDASIQGIISAIKELVPDGNVSGIGSTLNGIVDTKKGDNIDHKRYTVFIVSLIILQ